MKTEKTTFMNEFERYLKRLDQNETFNGLNITKFKWYQKVLGFYPDWSKGIRQKGKL